MWQAMLHDKKSVLDANKGQDRFSLRLLWDELWLHARLISFLNSV
jgi:hypothetical protein